VQHKAIGLDLDAGRLLAGKSTFRLLNLTLELAHGTSDVASSFFLVLLDEVVNNAVIEILSTKVGITGSRQDLKDTIVDRE
jgi:hypothetical protein